MEAEQRTRLRRSPPYCLGTVYTPECMIGKRLSCRRTSISPSSFSNKLEKQKIKFFFVFFKRTHTHLQQRDFSHPSFSCSSLCCGSKNTNRGFFGKNLFPFRSQFFKSTCFLQLSSFAKSKNGNFCLLGFLSLCVGSAILNDSQ